MTLDPNLEEMRRLGYLAVDSAVEHLAQLGERRVAQRVTAAGMQQLVHEPLPRAGLGVEDSLARFFDRILPAATLVNHPRFFAYIPGPGSFVGALGEWVAAATNTFVGTWLGGASMAELEVLVLDWLRQALGLEVGWRGILTTGGSMANLGAIAAARTRLTDVARGVVYTSVEAHFSVARAARVLGIGEERIRPLPTDADQRLLPETVVAAVQRDRAAGLAPFLVCATCGTTNTGAIDPLAALAALCQAEGLWLHIDGAYGSAAAMLPEFGELRAALGGADSLTLDPHKWLYSPFECGALLTRDPAALRTAFTADGTYMQDIPRDAVNFFELGPELSRSSRALKLWLLMRAVGLDAILAAIRQDLRLCRQAHHLLAADPRFVIVTPPRLSIFTFALRAGDAASQALLERILADGFLMLSSTQVAGRFVLRWCVVNHRTTQDDVRRAVERVQALV